MRNVADADATKVSEWKENNNNNNVYWFMEMEK